MANFLASSIVLSFNLGRLFSFNEIKRKMEHKSGSGGCQVLIEELKGTKELFWPLLGVPFVP